MSRIRQTPLSNPNLRVKSLETDMSALKNSLIQAYHYITWPWRKYETAQREKKLSIPISILFYHRVANEHPNDWTISESDFERQIDWMQKNLDLISLNEAQKRIRTGNSRPAVSITFDDGYAENCSFALPLLIERNIPFTYFVTTYHTTHNKPFPHDVKRGQPLPTNTIESLRALANAGVEIGAHSRTHPDFGQLLDEKTLFDEVIAATLEMEVLIDRPIRYFAFPYGQKNNLDPRVFQLLADHGFFGVCSAYGGLNEMHGDDFHLQRLHGDPSFDRVTNWLTCDPRLHLVKRYDWHRELQNLNIETESKRLAQPPV